MVDIFKVERGEVRTEAQRQRERIEQQAIEAGRQISTEAAEQRQAVATEATRVRERIEQESKDAQEAVRQQALESQAIVRKQQSVAEKEAEKLKAQAREAERVEQRKADLPITRPRKLGVTQFVANVETARRKAHKTGRNVRTAIDKEKDRFFDEVDKSTKEALADIDKQKSGIEADIEKAVVKAEIEIAKQKAVLDTQVDEWRGDSLAAIDKAQGDYNKAVAEFEATHVKLGSGEYVTKEDWAKLDKDAQNYIMTHGIEKGIVKYKDSLIPSEVFKDMQASGDIPKDAIFDSFDKDTGKVAYSIAVIGDVRDDKAWAEFEAANVKLDSGEYVSKADWEKLDSKYQDYLLRRGIEHGTELYNQYLEWQYSPLKLYKAKMPDGSYITIYAKTQAAAKTEAKERGAYTTTVHNIPTDPKLSPELYGEKVFANMIHREDIPKGAIFEGYDVKAEKVAYSMPDTRTPIEVFNDMVKGGDIPTDAILDSYNKETGELQYTVPDTRTAEQILADMIKAGDIPEGSVLDSFNKETQELSYLVPDTRTPQQMFSDMLKSGELPKDAVFEGEAPDGGFTYSCPSAVTIEVETAKGKVTMPLVEWESKTAIEQFAVVLGRSPTKTEWEGYRLMEAGVDLPWWKELIPGAADIVGTIGLLVPGEIEEERYVKIRSAASGEWQAAFPELKWGAAGITGLERLGFSAAKAFYPQVTVKDVTGKEWAMTGLNVALWTLPAWLPKVVRGIKVLMPSKLTARLRTVPFSETPGLQRIPAVRKTVVLTKTIGAKELGMSRAVYKRFLQARVATPRITPQIFKVLESVGGKVKAVAMPVVKRAAVRKPSGLPRYTYPRRVGVGEITKADWLRLWKPSQIQPTFAPKGWVVTGTGKYMPVGKTPISLPDVPVALVIRSPIITGTGVIISPVTIDHVIKSLGLNTAQVAGTQPLSTTQVNTLAKALGISQARVVTMVKQGKLSQIGQQQLTTLQKKLVGLTATQVVALTEALKKLQVKPLSQTEVSALAKTLTLTQQQTQTLLKSMTKLQPATQTATQTQTLTKLQQATQTLTATKTLTKLQAATETALKTKVKQATKTKVTTKKAVKTVKPVKAKITTTVHIPLPKLRESPAEKKRKYPVGSVAWKQGFIYKLIYPPYGEKDILYSKKPFPGVRTLKGVGSAYQTIIRLGGKVPPSIKRDMGIMDIEIKTPKEGKPKLLFRADIKQETWHGGPKGWKKRRFVNRRRTDRRKRRLQQSASRL